MFFTKMKTILGVPHSKNIPDDQLNSPLGMIVIIVTYDMTILKKIIHLEHHKYIL